jgi:holliday junction DNA helicase RuvA
MIAILTGTLVEQYGRNIVFVHHGDHNGMGYEVNMPPYTGDINVERPRIYVWTHQVVREDSVQLFAFKTPEEVEMFRLLLNKVTGVGPKAALKLMSIWHDELEPTLRLKESILAGNAARLSQNTGVGPKLAERVCLDMQKWVRDSLTDVEREALQKLIPVKDLVPDKAQLTIKVPFTEAMKEAMAALKSLGYKLTDAKEMIKNTANENTTIQNDTAALLKAALRRKV